MGAGRVGVAMFVLFLAAGCGDESADGLATTGSDWLDERGNEVDGIEVFRGDEHCGWQSVTILQMDSDIVPPEVPDDRWSSFVRDPEGVLPSGLVHGDLDVDASLPSDAVPTGHRTDSGVEIWFAPSEKNSVYLKSDDVTEQWPRGNAGCD